MQRAIVVAVVLILVASAWFEGVKYRRHQRFQAEMQKMEAVIKRGPKSTGGALPPLELGR